MNLQAVTVRLVGSCNENKFRLAGSRVTRMMQPESLFWILLSISNTLLWLDMTVKTDRDAERMSWSDHVQTKDAPHGALRQDLGFTATPDRPVSMCAVRQSAAPTPGDSTPYARMQT